MMKKKRFNATFAAVIAASLAAVSLMAGCGAGGEDAKETRVVSETQVVTRVVNGVFTDEDGNILKDADGQPLTAPSGTPDSNEKEKSEKEGSKTSDGKTDAGSEEKDEKDEKSESGKSDSGDSKSDASSKSSESKKTPEKKGDDGDSSNNLKLGGKECEVGDTVICTYYVTCPTKFINFQATLNYDSDKVNVEDAELSGSASSGSVINYLHRPENHMGNRYRRLQQRDDRQRRTHQRLQGGSGIRIIYSGRRQGADAPCFFYCGQARFPHILLDVL